MNVIGEQGKVSDKLILGGYLQVVPRLGLSVVHGIFLHTHEGGVWICLGIGITFTCDSKVIVVFQ